MLALYRCDRQADALQAYQDARRALVDELGHRARRAAARAGAGDPRPGPGARRARRAAPPPAARGAGAGPPARPARRLVSVLVRRASPRTELDPEVAARPAGPRFGAVIERHGGSVEDVVGRRRWSACSASPSCTRTTRCAPPAPRASCTPSGPASRLGVESGEVFVGGGVAAGDAAQRRRALRRPPRRRDPARRRGRAWSATPSRSSAAGGAAAARASAERPPPQPVRGPRRASWPRCRPRSPRRATSAPAGWSASIGPAGIGKSRLAHELAAGLDATVVTGGCPSYGEGVTYRPLAEIVGPARRARAASRRCSATGRPRRRCWPRPGCRRAGPGRRRRSGPCAGCSRRRPASARSSSCSRTCTGRSRRCSTCSTTSPSSRAATRSCSSASPGPSCSRRARRGRAAAGHPLLVLDPLPEADARRLVAAAGELGAGAAERIVETAEGNPLFLEQLVAVGADARRAARRASRPCWRRGSRGSSPASAALLEDASVQGRSFYADAELVPEATAAPPRRARRSGS